VTIDVSVRLVGSGARSTIISGGDHVLTIGAFGASSEPTVAIHGVTITGGVARSSPESTPRVGAEGVFAMGGGIEIPPGADWGPGASVSIADSVITRNRAAPTTAIDSGLPCPPDITIQCIDGDLPFALAAGGGIDDYGTLTLTRTTVSDNRVGAAAGLSNLASDAYAGGVLSHGAAGPVTITDSVIRDNVASASAPNGRFADSGGVFLESGTLTMSGSLVEGNSASLAASMPSDVLGGTLAVAGGVHVSGNSGGTVTGTTISGNAVSMTNTLGDATAFSGGLHTDTNISISGDVISGNTVTSRALPGSTGNAEGDSGAGELADTITGTLFLANSVVVSSAAGSAVAGGGASILNGTITDSVFAGNRVRAASPHGSASALAGGIQIAGVTTLERTRVSGNTILASGRSGSARGGGIFDAPALDGPAGGALTLDGSDVTGNVASGGPGVALHGGGLYIRSRPLTMTNSVITGNAPDQCYRC
jgi:hypothetical protein